MSHPFCKIQLPRLPGSPFNAPYFSSKLSSFWIAGGPAENDNYLNVVANAVTK